jgi:cell shape-determining protein MreC
MPLVKVEDTSFVRDTHSKAILNTDRNGLNEYYMKRELAKRQAEEKQQDKARLDKLENDMQEIKQLLQLIAANQDK